MVYLRDGRPVGSEAGGSRGHDRGCEGKRRQ